jgi:hypothetical protein
MPIPLKLRFAAACHQTLTQAREISLGNLFTARVPSNNNALRVEEQSRAQYFVSKS